MLTKEMELLVTENMGLAGSMAKQFIHTGIDYDDLRSAAYLGLIKAAERFDESKGFKFSSLAGKIMQNEILQLIRKQKKHRQCVSYDALMSRDGKEEITFLQLFGYEDPELERVENIGLYDFMMEDLSEREKQVVDLVIIQGISQTDLAPQLGMSQSYVSRVRKRAVQKMKQKMTPQLCKAARPDRNNQTLTV